VFTISANVLRIYIALITSTGYTYGALATPIAFLLFAFLIGFAVVLGAQLNNAIQETYPIHPLQRRKRIQRALGLRALLERLGLDRPPAPAPTAPEPARAATRPPEPPTWAERLANRNAEQGADPGAAEARSRPGEQERGAAAGPDRDRAHP
jgi:membrane protein